MIFSKKFPKNSSRPTRRPSSLGALSYHFHIVSLFTVCCRYNARTPSNLARVSLLRSVRCLHGYMLKSLKTHENGPKTQTANRDGKSRGAWPRLFCVLLPVLGLVLRSAGRCRVCMRPAILGASTGRKWAIKNRGIFPGLVSRDLLRLVQFRFVAVNIAFELHNFLFELVTICAVLVYDLIRHDGPGLICFPVVLA